MEGKPQKRKQKPLCYVCQQTRPALVRPKTGKKICKECFYDCFEAEIHQTIIENHLFQTGERVAIAASGGKGMNERRATSPVDID